jgi:hypothetical protein
MYDIDFAKTLIERQLNKNVYEVVPHIMTVQLESNGFWSNASQQKGIVKQGQYFQDRSIYYGNVDIIQNQSSNNNILGFGVTNNDTTISSTASLYCEQGVNQKRFENLFFDSIFQDESEMNHFWNIQGRWVTQLWNMYDNEFDLSPDSNSYDQLKKGGVHAVSTRISFKGFKAIMR